VDDIVVGADSEEELLSLQKQIVVLLRSGGCELKKWTSNCPQILQQVPKEDCAQQMSFDPTGILTLTTSLIILALRNLNYQSGRYYPLSLDYLIQSFPWPNAYVGKGVHAEALA